jgi:hypothetical protein
LVLEEIGVTFQIAELDGSSRGESPGVSLGRPVGVAAIPPVVGTVHQSARFGKLLEGSTEQQSGVTGDIDVFTGPVEESFRFASSCCPTEKDF